MSLNTQDIKANLIGMLHGGTLKKVRNPELAMGRAANTMLSRIKPLETERTVGLNSLVYDDQFNYPLPSDFSEIIDLIPQDVRNSSDKATRINFATFDLQKMLKNKKVTIEGSEGQKIIRINWRSRQGKLANGMDSLTANGTWQTVGTASNLKADSIFKVSGNASIEVDINASGDGIKNTTMNAVDLTTENQIADEFCRVYFTDVSKLTSITAVWGNDLTTKFWSGTAQTTQADGTAFRVGWNTIKTSWGTAVQTGIVAPSTINSLQFTVQCTGIIPKVRFDSVMFTIGRNFDLKYYSKYLFKSAAGIWIQRPTAVDDSDICILDEDLMQIYLLECLIAMAHQMEGSDSTFDIQWAQQELNGQVARNGRVVEPGLYAQYIRKYPNQVKKQIGSYGGVPFRNKWRR